MKTSIIMFVVVLALCLATLILFLEVSLDTPPQTEKVTSSTEVETAPEIKEESISVKEIATIALCFLLCVGCAAYSIVLMVQISPVETLNRTKRYLLREAKTSNTPWMHEIITTFLREESLPQAAEKNFEVFFILKSSIKYSREKEKINWFAAARGLHLDSMNTIVGGIRTEFLDIQNEDGETAAHIIVESLRKNYCAKKSIKKQEEILNWLRKSGADFTIKNKNGFRCSSCLPDNYAKMIQNRDAFFPPEEETEKQTTSQDETEKA